MLTAELLQHLMVSGRWMKASSAAEIRLGNQTAQFAAKLLPEIVQLLSIPGQIDRMGVIPGIQNFLHRKADEADPRISFRIFL